ncbi:hypothetical protein BRYFOR_09111 [Marvinbryantia formatexigens DSM 14469]|uniref:Uncharacterized protein n=1 Tax=Marvinbryantia formatexigens DSM 14469 TaxID=478749 RepID=C6LKC4_9FIRM|nr:hypothetical protein BRYFOR_09111 [Marvinbryantia formatexigens DSM 14469]
MLRTGADSWYNVHTDKVKRETGSSGYRRHAASPGTNLRKK